MSPPPQRETVVLHAAVCVMHLPPTLPTELLSPLCDLHCLMPHNLLLPTVHYTVLSSQSLSCTPAHDLLSFCANPEAEADVYAGAAHGRTSMTVEKLDVESCV